MKKLILCSFLTTGMMVGTAGVAEAAKPKKQESEVQKSLKQAYPDAETQITGTSDVNGVKVYDVSVKTKQGESTAQITDYGDFLMYGVPHDVSGVRGAIQQDIGGVFKSKPEDIEMYRVTNYFVEFKGPKNKNFTARFDAVGRLLDIEPAEAAKAKGQTGDAAASRGERIKDEETVKRVAEFVKRDLPDAQLEAVYPAPEQGEGFMVATLKGGGEMVVNKEGQVYSLRHPITKEDFPEPVAKTIQGIFTAPIASLHRGEYEYYQFNQQSQQGSPIVVKIRPNGDILDVQNQEAIQSEQAVQAKSKSKGKGAEKKG
jgi:hypothetical protein